MATGQARVFVTTESLYRRKIAALRNSLPDLKHVSQRASSATASMC
jgi:hypothetical protein